MTPQTEKSGIRSHRVRPRPSWRTGLPFFYGWVVVGSVFIAMTIIYGVYYSFSVFFVALLEEFGWSRASTAGVFSVFVLVIGFGGIAGGWLVDRFGPTRVFPAGALVLSLGLFAVSRLTEQWQFYLYFGGVCGLGLSLSGWVSCITVVSRWFRVRLGAALGVATAGVGMGIVVMVPFAQYLISSFGWRSAYMILGGVVLLGVAPQTAFFLVGRPEDLGLKPDGTASADAAVPRARPRVMVVVNQKWAAFPWTLGAALGTAPFWFLAGNMVLSTINNQMLWVHLVAYLVDSGHDKLLAASVSGLAGLCSIPFKILWGSIGDRIGREITFALGTAAMLLGIGLLVLVAVVPDLWFLLIFVVVFAAGYAVAAPVGPSAAADIFAGRHFGTVYGTLALAMGFGSGFGAWMGGYIFDVTGSYLAAFAAAALAMVGSAASLWLAAPRKVRRVPGRPRDETGYAG